MKKLMSFLTAGVLLASSLAAFAGCGAGEAEITDEALKAELFAAVAQVEFTQYEVNVNVKTVTTETSNLGGTDRTEYKFTRSIKSYEEDGKVNADIFVADGALYNVTFVRDGYEYCNIGFWEDSGVSVGNFSALMKKWKKDGVSYNSYEYTDEPFFGLNEEEMQSYGTLALEGGAKAYKKGGGYSVEIDIVKSQTNILGDSVTDVEDWVLRNMLGMRESNMDGVNSESHIRGSDLEYVVTVQLDGNMNLTSAILVQNFVTREDFSVDDGRLVGTSVRDCKGTVKLKVLSKAPKLYDVTDIIKK